MSIAAPPAEETAEAVTFERVSKAFGKTTVLDALSLDVRPGEFLTILGPSGSGKTTALNLLAGFTDVSAGDIRVGGRSVVQVPPEQRGLGMVFQSFALFPHLTVLENVEFPLRMRRVGRAARRAAALEVLERVHLAEFAARRPQQLSGGQKQRVSLARALVFKPRVLLMDECLSALDLKLREQLQLEIKRLHRELRPTILFVTHDQREALTMSDRVAVMDAGRLMQVDTPLAIYTRPANRFVASFIGTSNIFGRGQLAAMAPGGEALLAARWPGSVALFVVRPESIGRGAPAAPAEFAFDATLVDRSFLGEVEQDVVRLDDGSEVVVRRGLSGGAASGEPGQRMRFSVQAEHVHALPAD